MRELSASRSSATVFAETSPPPLRGAAAARRAAVPAPARLFARAPPLPPAELLLAAPFARVVLPDLARAVLLPLAVLARGEPLPLAPLAAAERFALAPVDDLPAAGFFAPGLARPPALPAPAAVDRERDVPFLAALDRDDAPPRFP